MKQKITLVLFLVIIAIATVLVSPLSPYYPQEALALSPASQGLKRSADFYFDVAAGDVRGHSSVNKFGRNPDIDQTKEDIWDGGGTWAAPTVAQVHSITSTSQTDAITGTGARTMQIYGLDSAGALINETVTLSGSNSISTTNEYLMIHRMIVRSGGSGGVNAGIIRATAGTDRTVTAQINATNNQTLMSIYQIPAANDGCMVQFSISVNKSAGAASLADAYLYAKPTGEVWQVKHLTGLMTTGTSELTHKYGVPKCFEPLTLIKLSAATSADNIDVSGAFDIVLHPN